MEEVEYYEIERWGWECPKCGCWNEEDDDPAYKSEIECNSGCGEKFIPVSG